MARKVFFRPLSMIFENFQVPAVALAEGKCWKIFRKLLKKSAFSKSLLQFFYIQNRTSSQISFQTDPVSVCALVSRYS